MQRPTKRLRVKMPASAATDDHEQTVFPDASVASEQVSDSKSDDSHEVDASTAHEEQTQRLPWESLSEEASAHQTEMLTDTIVNGDLIDEGAHGNKTSKKWVFRVSVRDGESVDELREPNMTSPLLLMVAYQFEVGGRTGRAHLQGCCELRKKLRSGQVAALLGLPYGIRNRSTHFAIMRGSVKQSVMYCVCERYCTSCHGGKLPRVEVDHTYPVCNCDSHKRKGHIPTRDAVLFGQPSIEFDAFEAVSSAEHGVSMQEQVRAAPEWMCRNFRYAQFLQSVMLPSRRTPPLVNWVWGRTGTGKSRAAFDLFAPSLTYVAWSSQWFDGLGPQHIHVILDDVRPSKAVQPAFYLRLLDRYPVRVPVKGSSMELSVPVVTFTSSMSPQCFWERLCTLNDTSEDVSQFMRRISRVVALPHQRSDMAGMRYSAQKYAHDSLHQVHADSGYNPRESAPPAIVPAIFAPQYQDPPADEVALGN